MFPVGDVNPMYRTPVVTRALVAANLVVFLLQGLLTTPALLALTFVPAELTALLQGEGGPGVIADMFTAMFLHGGLAHLIGNLVFLWIFGDNVEAALGKGWFLPFYLVCGLAATLAQYATAPLSTIPNLGASGAISGVLGAYLVLFPGAKVRVFIWPFSLFVGTPAVPAVIWIGLWFALQLFSGVQGLGGPAVGGVAFWAHIGGFVAGALLVWLLPRRPLPERPPAAL
ncbi:MAG TPA: rhomboid family intramembrane serine protease [Chloroflexaceae bacterium]|nr:rhomboid family intramembrane serine protease [Chloroflexaceae bacterium]